MVYILRTTFIEHCVRAHSRSQSKRAGDRFSSSGASRKYRVKSKARSWPIGEGNSEDSTAITWSDFYGYFCRARPGGVTTVKTIGLACKVFNIVALVDARKYLSQCERNRRRVYTIANSIRKQPGLSFPLSPNNSLARLIRNACRQISQR